MANQAYLSIWLQEFREANLLERFGEFLSTVPFSAKQPGFTHLEIRAVDSTETPVYEQDLRSFRPQPQSLHGQRLLNPSYPIEKRLDIFPRFFLIQQ
jgi:hypothetical protein